MVKTFPHLSYFLAQNDSNSSKIHKNPKMTEFRSKIYATCGKVNTFSNVSIVRLKWVLGSFTSLHGLSTTTKRFSSFWARASTRREVLFFACLPSGTTKHCVCATNTNVRTRPPKLLAKRAKIALSCARHISTKRSARALKFCRVVDLSKKNNFPKFQGSSCYSSEVTASTK